MKRINFPYIALFLGVPLFLLLVFGSRAGTDGATQLPLLTLLMVSEFAAIVTAIGAYIGLQELVSGGIKPMILISTLFCALLAVQFAIRGFELWPH